MWREPRGHLCTCKLPRGDSQSHPPGSFPEACSGLSSVWLCCRSCRWPTGAVCTCRPSSCLRHFPSMRKKICEYHESVVTWQLTVSRMNFTAAVWERILCSMPLGPIEAERLLRKPSIGSVSSSRFSFTSSGSRKERYLPTSRVICVAVEGLLCPPARVMRWLLNSSKNAPPE